MASLCAKSPYNVRSILVYAGQNVTDTRELTPNRCQRAREARDNRFDGLFFVAVKTTKIFCRPICPAPTALERNVEYFDHAAQASAAGYRPCIRCRPESAPGSWAWLGTATTLQRALVLIDQGALQTGTLGELAARLGISDRYLRQLFRRYLGLAPKQYALHHQLMFAKQLLHNSNLSIGDIGLASGFNSIRRFNDAFQKMLRLTPSQLRHQSPPSGVERQLTLPFRPPLDWPHLLAFYRLRAVAGVEQIGADHYARTFRLNGCAGSLRVAPASPTTLLMTFKLEDITQLRHLVARVRRLFDLDADLAMIEQHLLSTPLAPLVQSGLRIPGVWNCWEAGIRAILGQQISVRAAITLLNRFVEQLGTRSAEGTDRLFPEPAAVLASDLLFLAMPASRRATLHTFAAALAADPERPPDSWISLKGIGPWTIHYAKLRGLSEPDCFLATDLVVKKALKSLPPLEAADLSPWGSYATFHCWNTPL
jgi:AraC family transcriptional regulator of adaptative response / DNA-3-methyladenine glycosylase II